MKVYGTKEEMKALKVSGADKPSILELSRDLVEQVDKLNLVLGSIVNRDAVERDEEKHQHPNVLDEITENLMYVGKKIHQIRDCVECSLKQKIM